MEFHRMYGLDTGFERFIEASPYVYGAKERRHRAPIFRASTIEASIPLPTGRCRASVLRLQVIQDPRHNTATDLTSQCAELALKRRHLLRGWLVVEKLIQ
jgi:hypothetical protein